MDILVMLLALASPADGEGAQHVTVVERPPIEGRNEFYASNRPPLRPSPLVKLPVGAIEPRGWLRRQLELQAEGFIGRLGELSGFLRKEGNAWLSPQGEGHSHWEEAPYWLKGFGDTGYVLGDERIIVEARKWIEAALASQREDGWFGPRRNLVLTGGKPDMWPNMIMLFALQSHHEFTGDRRVLEFMTRYFRWQLGVPEEDFLPPYWQKQRAADNLMSVYWLYNRTGDEWLLELASKIHRNTADWSSGVVNWHNVNIAQAFGGPATWFLQSGDPRHLEAADRNYLAVRELYGQVPGGMFGGDENCRPGFSGPRQAIETCGMVEEMLSDETLLWITGDPLWADRCEDVAFNSLPASMTADLKALHYLTAPNMVLCDARSKAPGLQNSGPMLLFDPHGHRCCQHNMGHGWPYFAEHLWMATLDRGLAAVLYAASRVRARVGEGGGREVTIAASTHYPFDETVDLTVTTAAPVRFPLYLRVPGWCARPAVAVNGEPCEVEARPRSFIAIDREWRDGDAVTLRLPMDVRLRRWTKNHDSVSVDRGPLTYSLRIGERLERAGGTDRWPAWEIHPTTPWNYGLVLEGEDPAAGFELVRREWPADDQPFALDAAPIALRARARRIPAWKLDHLGLVGALQPSPARSTEPVETVTLVPLGAARLRISAFPTVSDGADAHEWIVPPEPRDPIPARASHVWRGDTVAALSDGLEPEDSNDHSIPRFTWWDRRGATEWVEYRFPAPRRVSAVEVYWFDDTGVGGCRVPASWRLLRRRGEEWTPVVVAEGGEFGVARDRFNRVAFEAVETAGLRIEATLRDGFSAGILEWRVGGDGILFADDLAGGAPAANGWTWIREDRESWRAGEEGLEIRPRPGSDWGGGNNTRNTLVRAVPEGEGAWAAEVAIRHGPEFQYEQAGLVWRRDDRNHIKLVKERVDGRDWIIMGREEDDRGRLAGRAPFEGEAVELRLAVRDGRCSGHYRAAPGEEWREVGACDLPAAPPDAESPDAESADAEAPTAQVGITAYNGPPEGERAARFRGFRLLRVE